MSGLAPLIEAGLVEVGSAEDGTVSLTAATMRQAARILGSSEPEIAADLRGILAAHGASGPAFEIRSGTWRINLLPTLARSAVAGLLAASALRLLGADDLPVTLLAAAAPYLLDIRQIEVTPDDALIHAQLRATAPDGPTPLRELYEALPDEVRTEMTLADFIGLTDRLVSARLATVGPGGVRLRTPRAKTGFRVALWDPPLLPEVLRLVERPKSPKSVLIDSGPTTNAASSESEPASPERIRPFSPRVFISYAHETPEHKSRVAEFAGFLTDCGMRVELDQWDLTAPRDWQIWATRQIREADFVLVIASPLCRAVGDGDNSPEHNRGLAAEMRTLRELIHADYATWRSRILPVVLPEARVEEIPMFLQPRTADHYLVSAFSRSGAEDLLRLMTGQPAARKPRPGPILAFPDDHEPPTP